MRDSLYSKLSLNPIMFLMFQLCTDHDGSTISQGKEFNLSKRQILHGSWPSLETCTSNPLEECKKINYLYMPPVI